MKTIHTNSFTALSLMVAALLAACTVRDEKNASTKRKGSDIQWRKEKAAQDYLEEMRRYKEEAGIQISKNEIAITNLELPEIRTAASNAYTSKVLKLQQRNTELKVRMQQCVVQDHQQWEQFRSAYNNDLSELVNALNNLSTNNVK